MSDREIDEMPPADEELERASLIEPPEEEEFEALSRGSHWKV